MRRIFAFLVFAFSACGGGVVQYVDHDASGNPAGDDGGVVLAPDGGIAGVSRNGWTWSNGGPQGADLFDAWGTGPSDVWFVGAAGTILHFDGQSFSAPDSGSSADLRGIWGSSSKDVWIVGRGEDLDHAEILHYDGTSWTTAQTLDGAELDAISGSSANDVWAAGAKGLTMHFDGASWTTVMADAKNDFAGVWTNGKEAWAVGGNPSFYAEGVIARWNGTTWTSVPTPTTETTFSRIAGTSENDLWLVGQAQMDLTQPGYDPSGYVVHWNGTSFDAPHVLTQYSTPLQAVLESMPSDVKAVGASGGVESFDGSTWSTRTLPGDFRAIWQSGPNDVWAAGIGGVLAHFDGQAWTELSPPPPPFGEYRATAIWANAPDDAWAVGNESISADIQHWDGHAWSTSKIVATSNAYLSFNALWGTSATNMWGAGSGPYTPSARIVHFDGKAWSDAYDVPKNYGFWSVWGASANDVWFAADDALLVHWDGTSMTPVAVPGPSSDQLRAIGGSSASDVWLVGNTNEDITFRHWDGHAWTVASTGAGFVTSVFATSPTDAWAVGWEGTAFHWDGSTWTAPSPDLPREVGAVWASSASDAWMVGWFGAVLHVTSNGATYVPITSADVVGVAGTSANDVWMITGQGGILHHP